MDQHFLTKDINRSNIQKNCTYELAMVFVDAIKQNDFYLAEQHLQSALRSVNELKRMQDKKKNHDRLQGMVNHLNEKGVTSMVIRRLANE